ncbi:MAG: pyridoxamine 5'-phosphate oxidase family protein [Acholeplasmatales bacterium]|nr:pyridoxamine 5'-phosphate oxidase family protein [Acholeplasmatales bacterium]
MFRKMRRFAQQTTTEEAINILLNEKRGVLSLIGDEGYPYGVPMNYYYDKESGNIYFHGAKEGHKIDSIKKNNKACFTVYTQGEKREGEWFYRPQSVICFGHINFINDIELTKKLLWPLGDKYFPSKEYTKAEIEESLNHVQVLELVIDHMTGKSVKEK